ncbi:hypothetical protein [Gracilibacillus suaedae]|uniref:hypothetical protein n=1 Tax=Gracilibacillus suaedae TaxID=2820273 RepID=UPI001ABE9F65|nr:hypothetical protein [Gracilibacillus suaedae]
MGEERKNKQVEHKERVDNKRKSVNDEKRPELYMFKEQQLVDDIPLRDLEIEEKNLKDKKNSQNTSQSEEKYKGK